MFQLVFPQPAMLSRYDLDSMISAVSQVGLSKVSLREKAEAIRATLNPHPAGQKEENVPVLHGQVVLGTQHKYRETILFFPTEVRAQPSKYWDTLLTEYRVNSVILSVLIASVGLSLPRLDRNNSSSLKRSSTLNATSASIHA